MALQDLISNPQYLLSLYGYWPSLKGGRITSIELIEDGPTIDIAILLNEVPNHPPQRWQRESFNVVIVIISFFGAESVSITNWGVNNLIEEFLVTDREINGIPWKRVDCRTKEVKLLLECVDIRIKNVVPFLLGEE